MKIRFLVSFCLLAAVFGFSLSGGISAQDSAVNFAEHVAPIIFKNCTPCHRPGEAAPFSLMNYIDVKKRGKLIATVTESRQMPPWKADQGSVEFKNERRLTAAQIETIKEWVAAGMPEGNLARMPPMPNFQDGWQLGKPDLIVKMREGFHVPADGPDIYRNFAIPLNLSEDRWIKAIAFLPGVRAVVHHSLFFYDSTGDALKQDEADPQPGYAGQMGGGLGRGTLQSLLGGNRGAQPRGAAFGSLGGWAVGGQARELPDGLAYFVPKGSALILSTHFHPSGKPETETSTIGLYFADKPPTKAFTGIQLPPLFGMFKGLDIPAGANDYAIEDSFVLPVDVKAFGAGAHAHYLGKTMKLTATLPNGQVKTLLNINDWDFAWQDQYQFKDYVTLPKGTRLHVRVTYDNTAANPRNPRNPPQRVTWGEGSFDEMGSMSLFVVAVNEREQPVLWQAYNEHLRSAFQNRKSSPNLLRRDD